LVRGNGTTTVTASINGETPAAASVTSLQPINP